MKLKTNYLRCILDAITWSRNQGPQCLQSLLDKLDYLDRMPQHTSVVTVSIGPSPFRGRPMPPDLSWAAYRAKEDGESWQDTQVIAGGLTCSSVTGKWSVNT